VACIAFAPDADSVEERERLMHDSSGHVAEYLGEICRRTSRASDAIGRLGPVEFGIVAPATQATGARQLVARLMTAIASHPFGLEGTEAPLQIRAGYAAVPNFAEASVDAVELLFRATGALRVARSEREGAAVRAFGDTSSSGS
jgi:diguanylate cyclase (GGDEF)-like protein